ncbi:ABC transporter permease [Telmatospirillum sp.]|uniref:ABC transporter permease n=1 Tax=Telmatospirillum sp. TaxID=2079197 RepID=UPI00284BD75F|nr:ABC transporter permease [Telmatospirillum sp.]MDR3437405.1 ABC transporter permease [Telmatospirillum sp.]
MTRYLIERIGQAVIVLWAAFTVTFILLHVLPGDAILIKFQNPDLGLGPQQIAEIRASYGVDRPLWLQYGHAIGSFLSGDFGYSIQAGVPVSESIRANLPPTLWLTGLGSLLAAVIAMIIAFAASLSPFAWLRALVRSAPALFVSIPTFWLGIALIQIFSFRLRLLPVIGAEGWRGLILPVTTLAIPISAPLAQILVRAIDDVATRPFVAVARAKGATHAWVLWRHVFRNALPPALTVAGVLFGELLGGALITETVFGLNGIGRLTQDAVNNQDAAVLQAVAVLSAVGFVVVNLGVDLLHPLLDPRLARKERVLS